jgi:F0F1-type ATP synthase assembly protein I
MAADQSHSGEIPTESAPPVGGVADPSKGPSSSDLAPLKPAIHAATSTSDRVAARTREAVRGLKLSSVGIELALSVLIGLFAGRWVDSRLGTDPWLMIVGLGLGFAAGLRSLMKMMERATKEADATDARSGIAASAVAVPPPDEEAPPSDDRKAGGGVL